MTLGARLPGVVATVTGVVTMLCALFGLLYNAQSLSVSVSGGFDDFARGPGMARFHAAFYTMSAICVVCYVLLLWGGFQLARRRFSHSRLLVGVWIFEVVYFGALGLIWRVYDLGLGVAGATGVANGGLMAQFFLLLPIWGPFAVVWAARRNALRVGRR